MRHTGSRLARPAAGLALLVLAALAALTLASTSAAATFKGVTYTLPAGWVQKTTPQAAQLSPKGNSQAAIVLLPLFDRAGATTAVAFRQLVKTGQQGLTVLQSTPLRKGTDAGQEYLAQFFAVKQRTVTSFRGYILVSKGPLSALATVFIGSQKAFDAVTADLDAFVGSLRVAGAAAPPPSTAVPSVGRIPTGDTPDLFPGMIGWLPSGRGTPIPAPVLASGGPVGIWYSLSATGRVTARLFLANGTVADFIRFGSGNTVDLDGHRRTTPTSVGTWTIAGGKLSIAMDGKRWSDAYTTGKDSFGAWFEAGGERFRPALPLSAKQSIGIWRNGSTQFAFAPGGKYAFGQAVSGSANGVDFVEGSQVVGTYVLDGYLIATRDNLGRLTVQAAFVATDDLIMINDFPYKRVPT